MPSSATSSMKPVAELLDYYGAGLNWCDPFSGDDTRCQFRNDYKHSKMDSFDWADSVPAELDGVFIDPPYSPRQVAEHYRDWRDGKPSQVDTQNIYARAYGAFASKIKPGGYLITAGWHSNGFGNKNEFKLLEVVLIAHGGAHNDTILTVEKRMYAQQKIFC